MSNLFDLLSLCIVAHTILDDNELSVHNDFGALICALCILHTGSHVLTLHNACRHAAVFRSIARSRRLYIHIEICTERLERVGGVRPEELVVLSEEQITAVEVETVRHHERNEGTLEGHAVGDGL